MFWNQYPYINLNDLNLDFLLKAIGEMQNEVKNFVTLNAVKYADPIQWDITSQYEKNTIVIDPLTGTAYISVQPVPSGVALNRTEYWTPVFDLSLFITQGNANLTEHVEDAGVIYSTFALNAGDWVIWKGELYKALVNMPIGTAYSVDSNIERVTVEEYIHKIIDDLDTEIQARIDADDAINNTIGDINDLTTTDKDSVVDAINEVVTAVGNIANDVGDLNDLTTTDKDSVVDAINELKTDISNISTIYEHFVNVKEVGVIGDGVTDDTQALQNAIDTYDCIFLPTGNYVITDTITVTHSCIIAGAGTLASIIIRGAGFVGDMFALDNSISVTMEQLRLANGGANHSEYNIANRGISITNASSGLYTFNTIWIDSGAIGFYFDNSFDIHLNGCVVMQESAYSNNGYMMECGLQAIGHFGAWIDNCWFCGQDATSPYFLHYGMLLQGADGVYISNCGFTAQTGLVMTNQYYTLDDVYIINSIFDNCTSSFIATASAGSNEPFVNIMIDNCHMDMTAHNHGNPGVAIDGKIKNFKISNSFIVGCSGTGIQIFGGNTYMGTASHDHSITNCYIAGVNQANSGSAVGIACQAGGVTINGNTITNSGIRSGHAKYGITFEAADILAVGNKIDTMETDYIYQSGGASNVIRAANMPASINT